MDLLSIEYELQLYILFESLDFSSLVNLTRSLTFIMLICKNIQNLLFSKNALNFWNRIWKQLDWNWDNIVDTKISWSYFKPENFRCFQHLEFP